MLKIAPLATICSTGPCAIKLWISISRLWNFEPVARHEPLEIGVGAENNVVPAALELKRERHIRLHIALRAECGNRNFSSNVHQSNPEMRAGERPPTSPARASRKGLPTTV